VDTPPPCSLRNLGGGRTGYQFGESHPISRAWRACWALSQLPSRWPILFPSGFRLVLRSHLRAHPENQYLFETTRCGPFTTRRIQQIVQSYRIRAGLTQPVHPHLFRHQMLTYLTAQGLSDAQLQLISGHASKKSLEVYQHLSLEAVEDAYQAAVRALDI
jgi:integrase/recombinase XerD